MTTRILLSRLVSPLLVLTITSALAAQPSQTAKDQQPGKFTVKFTEGTLSIDANAAPLNKVLQEVGKQAAIKIDSGIDPEETITTRFDNVPLEDAIRRLAKNVSFTYGQDAKGKPTRITRVVVLPEGNELAGRGNRSLEPATTKQTASKPEPFKFGFDPSKFSEKTKN